MPPVADSETLAALGRALHLLEGTPRDFDPLLRRAAGASVVLLGEASHGTHEFYRVRAEITKRLIREHGFSAGALGMRIARKPWVASGAFPSGCGAMPMCSISWGGSGPTMRRSPDRTPG